MITSPCHWRLCVTLFLVLPVPSALAGDDTPCLLARAHYDAGRFQAATVLLGQAMADGVCTTSADWHLLGKSWGRMAEQAPWYRALGLARKTRHALERAVEQDDSYLPALQDLRQFHLQAPAIVGGDRARAEQLGRRIQSLQSGVLAADGVSE